MHSWVSVIQESDGMKFYYTYFPTPINYNGIENAVWTKRVYVHDGISCTIHDSHQAYNKHLIETIDAYFNNNVKNLSISNIDKAIMMDARLKQLLSNAKASIKNNCIRSNPSKINDLRPN